MTKEDFPGRYPYRDSGLKYWEAIQTWVKDYLDVSLGWSQACVHSIVCDRAIAFVVTLRFSALQYYVGKGATMMMLVSCAYIRGYPCRYLCLL